MAYFDFVFELNSIPLNNNDFDYWDTNLGIKSKNLSKDFNLDVKKIDFFILYSPIYGGNYDVTRTIKGGFGVELNELLMIDLFFEDEFQFGAIAKFNSRYFSLSMFTVSHAYDDLHSQISRQYGINLFMQY